jgi:hypothetical protein
LPVNKVGGRWRRLKRSINVKIDAIGDHCDRRLGVERKQRTPVGVADCHHAIALAHRRRFVVAQLAPLDQAVGGRGPTSWAAQIGERITLLQQILTVVIVEDERRRCAALPPAMPSPYCASSIPSICTTS